MYIPPLFAVDDRETLHAFMTAHDFAMLTTVIDGAPFASHLPLMLDPERGPHGTLIGHMARANPQWQSFDRAEALAVFHGPHAYVSPTWYGVQPSVPTWNYAAVHAYGRATLTQGDAHTREALARLTALYEGAEGWSMADVSDTYVVGMMKGLVAFEMPISRLEGKFKLSQNRKPDDRRRVADRLAAVEDSGAQGTAALMRRHALTDAG